MFGGRLLNWSSGRHGFWLKWGDMRRISMRVALVQIGLLSCVERLSLNLRKTQPKCVRYYSLGPELQKSKQRQLSCSMNACFDLIWLFEFCCLDVPFVMQYNLELLAKNNLPPLGCFGSGDFITGTVIKLGHLCFLLFILVLFS